MGINLGSAEGHIDLDFSSLKKGVASSIKELEKLDREGDLVQSQYELLEATMKGTSGVFQDAAQKARKLTAEIDTAKKKVDTYEKSIDGLNSVVSKSKDEQTKLSQKIEDTSQKLEKAESKVKAAKTAYKEAESELKRLADAHGEESEKAKKAAETVEASKKAYEKATQTAQNYRNELLQQQTRYDSLNQEIDGSRQKITEYQTEINRTKTAISQMTEKLTLAESKLANMGITLDMSSQLLKKAGGKLDSIGNMLTIGVTTPLIGVGTAAIMAGNDFEAQMSRVKAISGATASEFEDLEQQAIDLGAATSFSATESAEAMENLASAGFSVSEITAAMPGMLNLAASSGEDLATSAEIASSTLRAFGLEAGEAGHVADVLAKNAADTNAAIMDTGYAMKYVAPVAHSAGWSLEEVTAAIGKMADEGIRGETAGTTLRSALVRMMKPTDQVAEAMEALGVTFYDAEGKMKPLSTIIDELQTATADLTDEQRDNRIATIFGTEALSGMKILLGSSKEELDALTEGLKNSDGAAQKMADTMLDNTKGSIEEMNGSLETAGITIQKTLAPWISKAAGYVTDLANEFSDLEPEVQGNILKFGGLAIASGPVIKGLGKVTSGVGSLAKGAGTLLKDLGKLSSAKKAAKAIGEIGTFSTKAVSGVSGLSKLLFNIPTPIGLAVTAAGVFTGGLIGISTAVKKAHDDMVKADLESRFGDIELSAEEVEDIAKRLTTNEWTMKIDAVIDAKEKLEEFQGEVEDAVSEMDKLGWKVGVGLELTEEEQKTFQDSATQYIQSTTKALEQQHYTANLTIDAMFTPGTSAYNTIKDATNELYGKTEAELQWLGQEYAKAVNESFADGVLTEDENLNLETIRQKIQNLVDDVSQAKYTGKLTALEMQFPDADITYESMQELQQGIHETLQEMSENAQTTYVAAVSDIELLFQKGAISDEEREELLKEAADTLNQKQGEITLQGLGVSIKKLNINYQDLISQYSTQFNQLIDEAISESIINEGQSDRWMDLWSYMVGNNLDPIARESLSEMLSTLQPDKQDLEKLAQSYKDLGQVPPENITKGLLDVYQLELMTGNTDHMFDVLAGQIATSPSAQKAVQEAVEAGNNIPEGLADALRENYGLVYKGGKDIFKQIQAPVPTKAQETKQIMSEAGLEISDSLAESLSSKGADIQKKTIELLNKINDGEALKEEELKTLLSNLGIQSADALITGLSSKSVEVQDQTVQLLASISGGVALQESEIKTLFSNLGINASDAVISAFSEKEPSVQAKAIDLLQQLQTAEASKRPDILTQLFNLGVAVDNSLGEGITDNLEIVDSETQGMLDVLDIASQKKIAEITPAFAERLRQMGIKGFDAMDQEMMNENLTAPSVDYISQQYAYKWAQDAQNKLETALSSFRIAGSVGISIFNNAIGGHAEGGIFSTPHIAAFAEDGPEAVIPLSPKYRIQGYEIWQRAGEELGLAESARKSMLKLPPPSNGIDYDLLAKKIADELRKAPLEVNSNVEVHNNNNLEIDLDGEIIGRKTAPTISRILSKK